MLEEVGNFPSGVLMVTILISSNEIEQMASYRSYSATGPNSLARNVGLIPVGAADTEIFQHNSPNTDLIRREFRPHGPSQVTASGNVQVSRLNSPLR